METSVMQSFETNDGCRLKYFDTGIGKEGEGKEWLVLVSVATFLFIL
jgi:hypothetical protein